MGKFYFFNEYLPQRNVLRPELGKTLRDIENHMPANHIYKDADKITWGHEASHGIASHLRQKFGHLYPYTQINGFYLLEDRAIILEELNTTISNISKHFPRKLQGDIYRLYVVQSQSYWNKQPLYLFDEWVAYSNGSQIRSELRPADRAETCQYMLEMMIYSLFAIYESNAQSRKLHKFTTWNMERTKNILLANDGIGNLRGAFGYLRKIKKYEGDFKEWLYGYIGKDKLGELLL